VFAVTHMIMTLDVDRAWSIYTKIS
jgi:hypothetical protein